MKIIRAEVGTATTVNIDDYESIKEHVVLVAQLDPTENEDAALKALHEKALHVWGVQTLRSLELATERRMKASKTTLAKQASDIWAVIKGQLGL